MTTAALTTTLRDWGWLDGWLPQAVDDAAAGGLAAVLAVVVAVGVGVAHAVGPGHGKVLIAAYLAGTDGRRRDAVALGWLVAAMHSGSVLVLGTTYLLVQRIPGGETTTRVLDAVVAVAVLAVGGVLLRRAWRRRPDADHAGGTVGTGEAAPDQHAHHHHHALPPGTAPLTRPGVLTLAAAGGLVPSPAAFLALVTAVAVGRPWLGLVLVGAFSVGLAATLTAVGLVVVNGRDRLLDPTRAGGRLGGPARWLAANLGWIAGIGVLLAGLVLLLRAVWGG